jgi:acyl carrier protein
MDEIAQRAKKVIADYLDMKPEEVKEDAVFTDDLDMDSLSIMELVMALEEEFSISFDDRSVDGITSVGDAIGLITTAVDAGAATA